MFRVNDYVEVVNTRSNNTKLFMHDGARGTINRITEHADGSTMIYVWMPPESTSISFLPSELKLINRN